MTNQERSEKIVSYQAANHLSWDKMQDLITSQLDEAQREARLFERTDGGMTINWKDGFDKGFAAAREKAASIADDHLKVNFHNDTSCLCDRVIADQIRKMSTGEA